MGRLTDRMGQAGSVRRRNKEKDGKNAEKAAATHMKFCI